MQQQDLFNGLVSAVSRFATTVDRSENTIRQLSEENQKQADEIKRLTERLAKLEPSTEEPHTNGANDVRGGADFVNRD